jgi:hypothetical protein
MGVVTRVAAGGKERQFSVFQDGAERHYFESQLELADVHAAAHLTAEELRAGLD